jgi:Histidine kinase-, DNA gyrase B-, and HSP90-like ATPase
MGGRRVNIRPGVSVLSVLRHLNYQPWYALAEFVDNAVQSFVDHFDRLIEVEGSQWRLQVDIEIDPTARSISIRDNAAGIRSADYERAFKAAAIPDNPTGLSEFGMGMKSAACWFAPRWEVRTGALDEATEGRVDFDIATIVSDSVEELAVHMSSKTPLSHYTEVVLKDVYKIPQGRTLAKIRDHLGSIYRQFLRKDRVQILLNGVALEYDEPKVLFAPYWRDARGTAVEWRRVIELQVEPGRRVHGFAALREKGSTSRAGFALFRRQRLIEGSADDGYRPEAIFGKSNSFAYQRLFGELHLEGFDVSHTKDGVRWEDSEDAFILLLREAIDSQPLPLLDQAEGHRARPPRSDLSRVAPELVRRTAAAVEARLPVALTSIATEQVQETPPNEIPSSGNLSERQIIARHAGDVWRISISIADGGGLDPWVSLAEETPVPEGSSYTRSLAIRFNATHPFTIRFAGADFKEMEPMLRIAAAMSIAESKARSGGVRLAGTIRQFVNDILRDAFAD